MIAVLPPDMSIVQAHASLRDHLPMWTVTAKPKDYPESYVARLHVALPRPFSTNVALISDNVDELREALANLGLVKLERDPSDDPVIMETWL